MRAAMIESNNQRNEKLSSAAGGSYNHRGR